MPNVAKADEPSDTPVNCTSCNWSGTVGDCTRAGHDECHCPKCGAEVERQQ